MATCRRTRKEYTPGPHRRGGLVKPRRQSSRKERRQKRTPLSEAAIHPPEPFVATGQHAGGDFGLDAMDVEMAAANPITDFFFAIERTVGTAGGRAHPATLRPRGE